MDEENRRQILEDYLADSDSYADFLATFRDYYLDNFAHEDKWNDFIKYLPFIVSNTEE